MEKQIEELNRRLEMLRLEKEEEKAEQAELSEKKVSAKEKERKRTERVKKPGGCYQRTAEGWNSKNIYRF